jgi:WXG100 family type VII secretion target
MSRLQVSSSAVEAAATAVAARVADFEARVGTLESLVSSTIGSDWIGSGAESFRDDFATWLAGAREVHEALSRITSLLTSASQTYESTENTVARASDDSSVRFTDSRTGA